MNYKELNKNQKDRMKQITANSYTMEWENPEFMGYLLGGLPRIRKTQEDKDVTGVLIKLEKVMSTYDSFLSHKVNFLNELKNIIALIQEKNLDFRSGQTLNRHAADHGYGADTGSYLQDARRFMDSPLTSTSADFLTDQGTYFRYDFATNEFGIINQYGGISTYFCPDEGSSYWYDQVARYAG